MTIYNQAEKAEEHAQREANAREQLWAVYRGRMGDYIAAPADPADFPFPGGRDCWKVAQRIGPSWWVR